MIEVEITGGITVLVDDGITEKREVELVGGLVVELANEGQQGIPGITDGTTSLQQSYNNSVIPQILMKLALGALTVQNSSEFGSLDTNAVVQIRNLIGDITARLNGDGSALFGNIVGSSYIKILSDGFQALVGTAYWIDIDFPIIIRNTGPNIPSISTLQGNLTAPQWSVNDFAVCEGQELVHGWKEGTEVFWHIHIYTGSAETQDRYLKFEIEYTWSNINGSLPVNVVVSSPELLVPAGTENRAHKLFSISSFIPTGGLIAGHVKARLKRVASTGLAVSENPFCEMLQLHIRCDTSGSRNIGTKGTL